MGGTGSGAEGVDNKVENKTKSNSKSKDLNIVVLFSPYSYDFLKKHCSPQVLNSVSTNEDYYAYHRFITVLEWTSKGKITKSLNEISVENTPAMSRQQEKLDFSKYDKYIFIDCSDEEVSKVLSMKDMVGYLSLAISEVKDTLYRESKRGFSGKVNFILAAYQPVQFLMFAMADLLDFTLKECDIYDGFISWFRQTYWFSNFKSWIEANNWTPVLKEADLYQGYLYGGSEETEYARIAKELKKYNDGLKEIWDFNEYNLGHKRYVLNWDKHECNRWKLLGRHTTEQTASGRLAKDYKIYGPEGDAWEGDHSWTPIFGTGEQPVKKIDGKYYTLNDMEIEKEKLDKQAMSASMAPKYFIGKTPTNQQGVDIAALVKADADDMQKQYDQWMSSTYNPQMKEYNETINIIDSRQKDTIEGDVWKRKNKEDEYISKNWGAGLDEILFHGKVVNRNKLDSEREKLNDQRKEWERSIEDQRNFVNKIQFLRAVSAIQCLLGFVSLGASGLCATFIIAIVDMGLETAKIAIDYKYDKNFKVSDAIWDHLFTFVMDIGSIGLALIPKFAKLGRAEKEAINSVVSKPTTLPQTSEKLGQAEKEAINSAVSKPTALPQTSEIQKPIKLKEGNSEIFGVATQRKTLTRYSSDSFNIGSGISDNKKQWVAIKDDKGKIQYVQKDSKWMKDNTGKSFSEWNAVRKQNKSSSNRVEALKEESESAAEGIEANKKLNELAESGNVNYTSAHSNESTTPKKEKKSLKTKLKEGEEDIENRLYGLADKKITFVSKQAKDIAEWLTDVREGINSIGGKDKTKYTHLVRAGGKTTVFAYTVNSACQNTIFVWNTYNTTPEELKEIGITEIDGKKVEDIIKK